MAKSTTKYERVEFKLIVMPCCGHMLCWVNPRYPTYCPTCGALCYPQVKQEVRFNDPHAVLELHEEGGE